MQNIIAVIWDFDKTLVDGYMQDPIFEDYGVDGFEFWSEVNALPQKYKDEGVKINPDTIYLNQFIKYVKQGKFKGLSNKKLREYGKNLRFYPGIPNIFKDTKELLTDDPICKEYNIRVEHYIVSTGFAEVIKGSSIMEYIEEIWGCELIEHELEDGSREIAEIGYTIDYSRWT